MTSGAGGNAQTNTGATNGINIDDGMKEIQVNGEACVAQVTDAELLNIDILLMLDTSSSMLEEMPTGGNKWDAVVDSLVQFVQDPATDQIGIGLSYFPKLRPDTPLQCQGNEDCGPGAGPCTTNKCTVTGTVEGQSYKAFGPTTTQSLCQSARDCAGGESCEAWTGVCIIQDQGEFFQLLDNSDNTLVCHDTSDCPVGTCDQFGYCERLDPDGYLIECMPQALPCPAEAGACLVSANACSNAALCGNSDYATPEVDVSTGPNRNNALIGSLTAKMPEGLTPTGPALAGAIQHAQSRELADPSRKVVAVMATDGFPTICDPLEIADVSNIALAGVQGTPAIETYVIGVFAASEAQRAQANLDLIATAGGTNNAFVIDTNSDVAAQFLDTLNEIRGAALTCDFAIPEPPSGEMLDLGQVNLEFVNGNGDSRQLVNVSDEAACANAPTSGWYYVREAGSAQPSQISVCPQVCSEFEAAMGASQVKLQIGCATIIK